MSGTPASLTPNDLLRCGHAEGQKDIEQHVRILNQVGAATGGVWDRHIILEIYSPDVPTLNMIDLPGMAAGC